MSSFKLTTDGGTEIELPVGVTIVFTIDGKSYEVSLTNK